MTDPAAPAPPTPTADAAAGKTKRPLLMRLFGIGPWGAFKLVLLCVLVGFFVMAANFNPSDPDTDIPGTLMMVARQALAAAGWAVKNFWKPALAGATIVMPLWILWRLASLPFRK